MCSERSNQFQAYYHFKPPLEVSFTISYLLSNNTTPAWASQSFVSFFLCFFLCFSLCFSFFLVVSRESWGPFSSTLARCCSVLLVQSTTDPPNLALDIVRAWISFLARTQLPLGEQLRKLLLYLPLLLKALAPLRRSLIKAPARLPRNRPALARQATCRMLMVLNLLYTLSIGYVICDSL